MAYVGNQPARGQWRKLTDISGSFNGVTTTFTTSVPPGTSEYYVTAGSSSQLLISLGGVIQQPDTDYTVSTNSITFTTAPTAGLSFFGVLCGDALNTGAPSDGSVTTAKLAGSLSVGLAAGSAAAPSLYFTGDSNNGIYSPSADNLSITTNGTERIRFDSTGQIEAVSLGSASAPTWSYTGDPNTGTFSPGADTWGVSTGGSERLRVDSNGRVGIGTQTPGYKLHCVGDARFENSNVFLDDDSKALVFGTGTTAYIIGSSTNNNIRFVTNSSERGRWDSNGRFLVGTSTARTNFFNLTNIGPALQVEGDGTANSSASLVRNSADSAPPSLILAKSRSTSYGVVSSGDALGRIPFMGADGSELVEAALIIAEVDGTPGANDMPGRLVFSTTADGASSPTERLRITSAALTTIYLRGSSATDTGTMGFSNSSGTNAWSISTNATNFYIADADFSNYAYLSQNPTTWQWASDARLKENIIELDYGIEALKQIKPRRFNFIGNSKTQLGFIAQELRQVIPEAVDGEEIPYDDNDTPQQKAEKSLGLSRDTLVPVLVKALQEAIERIETLEAKVVALETS